MQGSTKSILEKPKGGWTPLCEAVAAGDVEQAKALVHQAQMSGHDILNMETMYGDTPLLIAAQLNLLPCIHLLLALKASPTYENRYGETGLIRAALSESMEAVKTLVKGNELSAKEATEAGFENTKGETALTRACAQNKVGTAIEIVRLRSNVNHETKKGITALHTAASNDLSTLALALVRAKADINKETINTRQTPIMAASANSKPRMIETLAAHGGRIDHESSVGDTAMSFAAKRGIISAIKDLLDKKADIECDTRQQQLSVFVAYTLHVDLTSGCELSHVVSGWMVIRPSDMQ